MGAVGICSPTGSSSELLSIFWQAAFGIGSTMGLRARGAETIRP